MSDVADDTRNWLTAKTIALVQTCFQAPFNTSIFEFNNILDQIGVSKGHHTDFNTLTNLYLDYNSVDYVLDKDHKPFLFKSDPIKTFQFAHPVLRFFCHSFHVAQSQFQGKLR